MFESKAFWLANNVAVLALYGVAGILALQGQMVHGAVVLAAVVLAAHVLEIPVAARVLRGKSESIPRLALFTVLFGFTWWVPAHKGIYRA